MLEFRVTLPWRASAATSLACHRSDRECTEIFLSEFVLSHCEFVSLEPWHRASRDVRARTVPEAPGLIWGTKIQTHKQNQL